MMVETERLGSASEKLAWAIQKNDMPTLYTRELLQ